MNKSLHILDIEYSQWKEMKTFLSGTAFYIQNNLSYILVLVDLQRGFITLSHLKFKAKTDKANTIDFETNIKPTAVSQATIEACIAAAIIGSGK
jgi:hypothetical protein